MNSRRLSSNENLSRWLRAGAVQHFGSRSSSAMSRAGEQISGSCGMAARRHVPSAIPGEQLRTLVAKPCHLIVKCLCKRPGMCQNSVLESLSQDYPPIIVQTQAELAASRGESSVNSRLSCATRGEN